jgi:hypothetical protein
MEKQENEQNNKKDKELKSTTIALMICTAIFFDILQWFLAFIFMDWLAGIYAFLTFYVWFKVHGIKFAKPKRALALGGAGLIEMIPIFSALPAWTAAVSYIALDTKIKKVIGSVPGGNLVKDAVEKTGIMKK